MNKKSLIVCILLWTSISYAQFPLQIGNRWDIAFGTWDYQGNSSSDTTVFKITSETTMPNGHKYFRIIPAYYYFKDFVRADSIGLYYYDTLNAREWLLFKFDMENGSENYPGSEHISAAFMRDTTDTLSIIKIYKWSDGRQLIFGDSVRVITYFYDMGLDDSYFVTFSPQLGFIGTHENGWGYNIDSFITGCVLSGTGYGTLTPIAKEQTLPVSSVLYQNYPNPFNPTTIISYSVPKRNFVTIKVFDTLGRQVAVLVKEEKPAGSYNVTFDGSKYSSGVYFYSITAGSFRQTKKMVLMK